MHIKIQGGGKNAGVHANTGSSAALVSYLQHEDQERLAEGKEVFPFFTGTGVSVTPGEVIEKLDRNKKKLSKTDAKFFHIDINPSKDEIPYLGSSDAEIVANATFLCHKLADEYARNFNHAKIHGAEDVMIFFKPHFTRGKSDNLEFHIHGIVSRKDIHNSVKLSPMSNHRSTSNGPVKGGFDRKKFQESCERIFDETFSYDRKVSDTFAYKLAMKKGTVEEKAVQEAKMSDDERRELISQKVDLIMPGAADAIENGYKRLAKARRDRFWNDYHSKYKPLYDSLATACVKTHKLYISAKDQYSLASKEISAQYTQLRSTYVQMHSCSEKLEQIQTSKEFLNAVAALLLLFNPLAAIALKLTTSIITEAHASDVKGAKINLYKQAQSVKKDIEVLKHQQDALKQQKSDRLSEYLENKEAKVNLQAQINNLKAELDALRESDLLQSKKKHVEKYIASSAASNLITRINQTFSSFSNHYHLVPGALKDNGDGTFRWILHEDGFTSNNRQIYQKHDPAPQPYGESYVDFSFNEKGELLAVIESDNINYYTNGVSGTYNLTTCVGDIFERKYAGAKKDRSLRGIEKRTTPLPAKKKSGIRR